MKNKTDKVCISQGAMRGNSWYYWYWILWITYYNEELQALNQFRYSWK